MKSSSLEARRWIERSLLLAPFFGLLVLFWAVPLLRGVWLSWLDWGGGIAYKYIGWQNYAALLGDERYWRAVWNTLRYAFLAGFFALLLGLLLAICLSKAWRWLRGPLTFGLMVPGLCPPVVLGMLFLLVFHGDEGLLNRWLLRPFGIEAINWLMDPAFILWAMALQAVWRWAGFMCFFIGCAWQARPREILEAARLDGAGAWSRFWSVSLPLIAPTLTFCAIYLLIDSFSQLAGSYVLFGGSGGAEDAGLLLVTYAYQKAYFFGEFGAGVAISLSIIPWLGGMLCLVALAPRLCWKGGAP